MKAVYQTLSGDAPLAALVGSRIYDRPPQDVGHPFIALGDAFGTPLQGQGVDGNEVRFAIDVYSRAQGRVETRRIMAAVRKALDNADLPLEAGALVRCQVFGSREFPDPDGETTRGVVEFEIATDG